MKRPLKWTSEFIISCLGIVLLTTPSQCAEAGQIGNSHIGTFEGSTTFTVSSENGIQPTLFLEVIDKKGNLTQYESKKGSITIPNTEEGATVKRAILKGQNLINLASPHEEKEVVFKHRFQMYGVTNNLGLGGLKEGQLIYMSMEVNIHELNTINKSFVSATMRGTGGHQHTIYNLEYLKKLPKDTWVKLSTIRSVKENESDSQYSFLFGLIGEVLDGDVSPLARVSFRNPMWINLTDMFGEGNEPTKEECDKISYFSGEQSVQKPVLSISNGDGTKMSELTVASDLVIRTNEEVSDELDLMTGKLTKRIDENNRTLSQEVVTTVDLKNTYQFPRLNKSFVQVTGNVSPIITSITVPTSDLSFSIDPNQEARQQFISPEFEVTNESNAPLTLTLKTFEQTTDILNDVLPSEHDSWDGLTKEESKDIALGLVAKSSDAWLSHVDDPHYVSETNNNLLGTIKPKGTIGFEFIAHHGQAFDEILNPSYRLTFIFDLLN